LNPVRSTSRCEPSRALLTCSSYLRRRCSNRFRAAPLKPYSHAASLLRRYHGGYARSWRLGAGVDQAHGHSAHSRARRTLRIAPRSRSLVALTRCNSIQSSTRLKQSTMASLAARWDPELIRRKSCCLKTGYEPLARFVVLEDPQHVRPGHGPLEFLSSRGP
jgi:hypothetical protein